MQEDIKVMKHRTPKRMRLHNAQRDAMEEWAHMQAPTPTTPDEQRTINQESEAPETK